MHQQAKASHVQVAATLPAVAVPWAGGCSQSVVDATATHSFVRPVRDPSDLGSDPDSWLWYSHLRVRRNATSQEARARAETAGHHRKRQQAVECAYLQQQKKRP